MHEIRINIDCCHGHHPPKIVIEQNGRTLIDMPADEFAGWLMIQLGEEGRVLSAKACCGRPARGENSEGDVPSPDGDRPSESLPGTGA